MKGRGLGPEERKLPQENLLIPLFHRGDKCSPRKHPATCPPQGRWFPGLGRPGCFPSCLTLPLTPHPVPGHLPLASQARLAFLWSQEPPSACPQLSRAWPSAGSLSPGLEARPQCRLRRGALLAPCPRESACPSPALPPVCWISQEKPGLQAPAGPSAWRGPAAAPWAHPKRKAAPPGCRSPVNKGPAALEFSLWPVETSRWFPINHSLWCLRGQKRSRTKPLF